MDVGSKERHVDDRHEPRASGRKRFASRAPTLEVRDVLYVPLRFFTDVLGAQATFDRRANTVTIVAQLVGSSGTGVVKTGAGYERFGTVAAVDVVSDPPTITLGYNGSVKTIPIGPNAIVDVEDVNVNVTSPGELGDVRPGDFARVKMRKDGRVERVVDEYGSRSGRSSLSPEDSSYSATGRSSRTGETPRSRSTARRRSFPTCGRATSSPCATTSRRTKCAKCSQRATSAARPTATAGLRIDFGRIRCRPSAAAGRHRSGDHARDAGGLGHLRYRLRRLESGDARSLARNLRRATTRFRAGRARSEVPLIGRLASGAERRWGRRRRRSLGLERAARHQRLRAGRRRDDQHAASCGLRRASWPMPFQSIPRARTFR